VSLIDCHFVSVNTLQNNGKPRVYFVFPYHGVGGVPVLFVRVGEYLASRGFIEAYFVDFADGVMAKIMRPGVGNLLVYADNKKTHIPNGAYAVFQSMTPWSIFPGLAVADSVKLLFWNCHPFNLIPTLPGFRSYMHTHVVGAQWLLRTVMFFWRKRMRVFLDTLLTCRAIVFMDMNNVKTTQVYLEKSIPVVDYLPIPVSTMGVSCSRLKSRDWVSNPVIRIVWIGRVVDFKFFILKRTLYALEAAQASLIYPVEFIIVGEGEFQESLKVVADGLKRVKVKFIKRIEVSELDDFLLANTDLLMAMGTSVLEGARLGIPAILLDMSYAEVSEQYHFQWLYNRNGYTLADMITSEHLVEHDQSLLHRLNELLEDYEVQSERCIRYVVSNHSLEVQSERFLNYLLRSELTWGDLHMAGHLNRGWLYPVFRTLRGLLHPI